MITLLFLVLIGYPTILFVFLLNSEMKNDLKSKLIIARSFQYTFSAY